MTVTHPFFPQIFQTYSMPGLQRGAENTLQKLSLLFSRRMHHVAGTEGSKQAIVVQGNTHFHWGSAKCYW